MYGETSIIRRLARQLRERGDEIRNEAHELAGRAQTVPWTGLAADAMRRMSGDHAVRLLACAAAHDAAADALDHHAREVDHVKEMIAAIEHRALRLLDSAASGVAHLVGHVLPDAVDHWAHHFDPPPTGSRAWLDVRLPRVA